MLIGLAGTLGSGVEDVIKALCKIENFKLIGLESQFEELNKFEIQEEILSTPRIFKDDISMLNYVTTNWRDHMIIPNVSEIDNIELFVKRPFFLLVSIDSPLLIKFNRYKKSTDSNITLEKFCSITDLNLLSSNSNHCKFQDIAQLKLINNTTNFKSLFNSLQKLNLTNPERLRPEWDSYFMHFADLAAMRANCMKRRVGCVIVRNNRVVATGYNGTPRGFTNCNEGGCYRCNHPLIESNSSGVALSTCLCLHAEENALLEAGYARLGDNSILFCNTCPCLTCSIKIVQMGITEVIYSQSYSMDSFSEKVFKEAGVKFRQFIPPTYGTVVLDDN
ncbi:Deoxycytidine monophosphate (dCMP) deaminase [Pichia californica]|uniref:Deoxycytidylate deaminase n=1 Tax=Pichia californica TaxID=460514 RepID=A0A9P7BF90_9ASCO|nr:Deoxycytidine monophosphate (dCMP) deaminase [[Candida] californica]KAG0687845.1 Deoxycytidine monophosphate (dCMP) deaminase [[Candida] californica]